MVTLLIIWTIYIAFVTILTYTLIQKVERNEMLKNSIYKQTLRKDYITIIFFTLGIMTLISVYLLSQM